MFDDFEDGVKSHIPEPDLVPILDALTSLIFFLLLSATFIELTKLTLPPSQTEAVAVSSNVKPLDPVFSYVHKTEESGEKAEMTLVWKGAQAGELHRSIEVSKLSKDYKKIQQASEELINEFLQNFPNEKVVQLSLSGNSTYQEMISVMDGIRKRVQDIVLVGGR